MHLTKKKIAYLKKKNIFGKNSVFSIWILQSWF